MNAQNPLPADASPEGIATAAFTLQPAGGRSFDVVVDSGEKDELTTAILAGAYQLPTIYYVLPALAPPDARVLDLGAHVGIFSLYAAAQGYQVVSVEASPHNAQLLRTGRARNRFEHLRIVQTAVSDKPGTLEFIALGPYGLVANPLIDAPRITVSATTVEAILDQVGWDSPAFIKLDIEGSEPAALRGMQHVLSRADAPPVLFESNGWTLAVFDKSPCDLFAEFEQHGYHCFFIGDRTLTPVGPTDIQAQVVAECLALKCVPDRVGAWRFVAPRRQADVIKGTLALCSSDALYARIYIGHELARHPDLVASDVKIARALDALAVDPHPWVQQAASWWVPGVSQPVQAGPARQPQHAEGDLTQRPRASLRAAGHERFASLRRWLRRITSRPGA